MKTKIPNILTIGRIIIVPIFVVSFFLPFAIAKMGKSCKPSSFKTSLDTEYCPFPPSIITKSGKESDPDFSLIAFENHLNKTSFIIP